MTATVTDTTPVEVSWQDTIEVHGIGGHSQQMLEWTVERHPDMRAALLRTIELHDSPETAPSRAGGVYVKGGLTNRDMAAQRLAWLDEQAERAQMIADARIEAVMVRLFMQETDFADEPTRQQVLFRIARSEFRETYRERAVQILADVDQTVAAFGG